MVSVRTVFLGYVQVAEDLDQDFGEPKVAPDLLSGQLVQQGS